jgi:D-alanyl-D-alanine carboxypeptidase/D-alanyl-D-alanine-endopeptidase (penicillin-binding protein 4)
MKGQPLALRERIKVKSGSMNGVRCYTGYILTAGYTLPSADGSLPEEIRSKTIVFSILTNNCTSPSWKVRPLLDKIMVTLASAN